MLQKVEKRYEVRWYQEWTEWDIWKFLFRNQKSESYIMVNIYDIRKLTLPNIVYFGRKQRVITNIGILPIAIFTMYFRTVLNMISDLFKL